MRPYPDLPALEEVPDDYFRGSVWIQELVAGEPLRFGVGEEGYLRFAAGTRTFDGDGVPSLRLRRTVRHVLESFDAAAFRADATDPTAFVFYGVATVRAGVAYDWARLPPFLGFDVLDTRRERWLPNDGVERAFEGLGLDSVGAFERELPARHFYPARYEVPESAWYDGPPAGIVIRDSHGNRATRRNPDVARSEDVRPDLPADPEEFAAAVVTPDLVERVASDVSGFDGVFETTLDEVFRLHHGAVRDDPDWLRAFRGAAAGRVRAFVGD